MKILAIDPSVNSVGWATYDTETEEYQWGMWSIHGLNYKMRCTDIRQYIEAEIGEFDKLLCEWPAFYGGDKGAVAAQQGYTINLAGVAMYIAGWFHISHQNLELITAPMWKGQVPKAVTARRFYQTFDVKMRDVDHNAIDATMMLVWYNHRIATKGKL